MGNIINKILALLNSESTDKRKVLVIESRIQSLDFVN